MGQGLSASGTLEHGILASNQENNKTRILLLDLTFQVSMDYAAVVDCFEAFCNLPSNDPNVRLI